MLANQEISDQHVKDFGSEFSRHLSKVGRAGAEIALLLFLI